MKKFFRVAILCASFAVSLTSCTDDLYDELGMDERTDERVPAPGAPPASPRPEPTPDPRRLEQAQ